jgi:hypothetical protein
MRINALSMARGVLTVLIGFGILVAFKDISSKCTTLPTNTYLVLGLCTGTALILGAIDLLRVLHRMGMQDITDHVTDEGEDWRRTYKALYYEFSPFFKSGNDVLVPQAVVPGDLGRRVSEALLSVSTSKT